MEYPEPLQDYALTQITRGIQSGLYPMGSKLAPQRIAQTLGISSTPVVAALNRLATQGLVEMIPRRGAVVKKFTPEDIRSHFDTRIMMESWAAKSAIRNVERFPDIVREMDDLAYSLSAVEDETLSDLDAIRDIDTRFHTLLVQLAGNAQLSRLYEFNWSVGSVFFVYSVGKVKPENLKISLLEHREIVTALKARDEKWLQDLLQNHFRFLSKALEWYH